MRRAELDRIRAFLSDLEDRAARRIDPVLGGVALFNDQVPNVWFANQIRLDAEADMTAGEVTAEAERVQGAASLGHRQVIVYDGAAGTRLAPGLRALGWDVERVMVMVQQEAPEEPLVTSSVRELLDGSWRRFRHHTNEDLEPETKRQMAVARERLIETVGLRMFGIDLDGVVASGCDFFSDGATAQIEAVGTLAPYRNRGLAKQVVWRCVEEARSLGHNLIFLLADADDWPRTLYRRMGFKEIGSFYEFAKVVNGPTHHRRRLTAARSLNREMPDLTA